jgi:hypothetical protein
MKKEIVKKVLAGIITFSVLIILIVSAPASAYILNLQFPSKELTKGEQIKFHASIDIEPEDNPTIDYVQLKLAGPIVVNCKFYVNGSIISGCRGITIEKIKVDTCDEGYDYGYCYGYESKKKLKYEIMLDSSTYIVGKYNSIFSLYSNKKEIAKISGETLTVNAVKPKKNIKSCSIRAKDGSSMIEGSDFGTNNKINFYVPIVGARSGEGFITGQKGRTTLSYNFKVKDIVENDENHTAISVTGKYRIGIGKEQIEDAIITLDKRNNKIDVFGENINIVYMNVNFKDGCIDA